VISNWEEWLERLLQDLDLLPFFDVVIVSGVEGCEKPDVELFHRGLTRLGVAPAAAMHVGDSPESDCAPAQAAGMAAVLLDRHDRHLTSPYRRIHGLEELLGLIDTDGTRATSNQIQDRES
jgi:putative hydrolase of the HAD superfamily